MDLLIEACLRHLRAGQAKDFVTGNNDADAVYLLRWAHTHYPEQVERCASGCWPGAVTPAG